MVGVATGVKVESIAVGVDEGGREDSPTQPSVSNDKHVTCRSSSGIVPDTAMKEQVRLSSALPALFSTSMSSSYMNTSTNPKPTTLFPQNVESRTLTAAPKLRTTYVPGCNVVVKKMSYETTWKVCHWFYLLRNPDYTRCL